MDCVIVRRSIPIRLPPSILAKNIILTSIKKWSVAANALLRSRLETPTKRRTAMKTNIFWIFCLFVLFGSGSIATLRALAQEAAEPLITLSVKDEPLGDALETITRETGYQFNISRKWQDYTVSANIFRLPLEQGLKRLLRSLNHTIIWESDKVITIRVYGKTEPGRGGPSLPYPVSPAPHQEDEEMDLPVEPDIEPTDEPEPDDAMEGEPAAGADEP